MDDLLRRLSALPAPLLDGTLTHFTLQVHGYRLIFSEMPAQVQRRRRQGLRRRAVLTVAAGSCLLLALVVPREAQQVALALLGAMLGLTALEGLRRDLRGGARPQAYAVIDVGRQEVLLLRPGGPRLTLPLGDLTMFLLVADPAQRRFHLGVVMLETVFLPWLQTHSSEAANSLVWLLGHLTDRPARRMISESPPTLPDFSQAEAIAMPGD